MDNSFKKGSGAYSMNYIEYAVKMKNTPSLITKKILLIAVSAILIAASFYFLGTFMPQILAVLALVIIIGVWFLWRFVSVEFEYIILQGEFQMDVIYGKRMRKRLYSFKIRDADIIAPVKSPMFAKKKRECDRYIFSAARLSNPGTYFACFTDEQKKKCTVVFEVMKKSRDVLKYYNHTVEMNPDITL